MGSGDWQSDGAGRFGPFDSRAEANDCVRILARRETIISAELEEVEHKKDSGRPLDDRDAT